jgi:hypothetical protein
MFNTIKNYFLIWDEDKLGYINSHGFINLILKDQYNSNELIKTKFIMNTKYSYIILNNKPYEIFCNVVHKGKNIIALNKLW